MIVLDTNVISEIFRREPSVAVVGWLESLSEDVAITTVTLAELLVGVGSLPEGRRRDELEETITAALRPYRNSRSLLAFDDAAAEAYADIVVARARAGRPISMGDAQIAAICRVHGATCATRNMKDFVETGVPLIDPWTIGLDA